MGIRKLIGAALAGASSIVPFLKVFGPLVGRIVPGDRDDRLINGVIAKTESMFAKFNSIVLGVQRTGNILGDSTLSGAQKARMAGAEMGDEIAIGMTLAGMKFKDAESEKVFEEKCAALAGNWADIMECFQPK